MNLKKILISLIAVMLIVLTAMQSTVSAKEILAEGKETYMGILPLMENNLPHMGYAIDDVSTRIWNIVRYKTSRPGDGYDNINIYCLKAGVGFASGDSITEPVPYNVNYNMKTEKDSVDGVSQNGIKSQNEILRQLVEKTITEGGTTISRYNALLAVLDMLYLPGESTQAEKTELIRTIIQYGIDTGHGGNYMDELYPYPLEEKNVLTENEINAVQQAVIWYFTNYGENDGKYDKTEDNEVWFKFSEDGNTYVAPGNYNPDGVNPQVCQGQLRAYQAEFLYNYMINQAKAKANQYENISTASGSPIRVDTAQELQSEISGNNCIIGPIHMTQMNTNGYTLGFTVKNNGNTITNYQLLKEDKTAVTNGTTVKDLVGKDFYISLPKSQVTSLTIDIDVDYNERSMTLWASTKNNQEQPLAEVKNTTTSVPTTTLRLEREEKNFDLALRKYITKINNGPELSGANSRVPSIDESTLISGTTAKYKHKKDPVEVATGDKVTYKLTIYNEGQKAGRATKVVDQLPTGLQFSRVVSGNFELETYNESTNTLNLKRKDGNTTNLPAYIAGNLVNNGVGSETIEIECTVTATTDTLNDKILTNVAWIAEEYDAEENVTITNQEGLDRDSEPENKPNVSKDNMTDYKGNDKNKDSLTDSEYYYEGKQDDDDFEKLVLKGKPMDLALRKYITKINDGPELSGNNSRVPNIDEGSLQTGTTATYKHKKDPVEVATGDKVTYKLTIYNEGQKVGRATKVVDQLPTGLQFSRVVSGNFDVETYNESTNTLNLKRKDGNTTNLPAYIAGNLVNNGVGSETIEIECIVTATTDALNDKILTNVAWIAEEYDAEANVTITNQEGLDRDSEPENKPNVSKDNMSNYKGNDQNKDSLVDREYYYEGKQDDDDFEKLVLKGKPMDLALRKYITKINDGPELSGKNSRVPKIDESTLQGGTTATYNHKKNPVEVATGDKVTYKLTIYNEGRKEGRATKVVDQLPTGLQFSRVVSGNFEVETYNKNTNTLNLKRKDGNTTNLPAYVEGNLVNNGVGSETIEIECIVTEKPDTKNSKVLTNVAWIAEEYDAEANVTITNQEGLDRDSEPENKPSVSKDTMEDYKGNDKNKDELNDGEYYYKGQQDDDDFEKLVLLPETFDLKLIKRITEVNGEKVPERIEKIDASKLNTLDEDGNMITTADYQLNKIPVTVKTGDIVTYTFRIYNEGTIDGYANEITEDIPEGLQFLGSLVGDDMKPITDEDEIEAVEFNATNGWSYVEGDTSKIKTTALALHPIVNNVPDPIAHTENLIKAFGKNDGTKTEDDLFYKEISVKFKVISDEIGVPIKNEAAITEDCDKDGEPVDDRDSHTDEWKEDPNHEDDEDHDFVILQSFDLALRKFIVAVSKDTKIENDEYLRNQDGSYKRAPEVDTSRLNTLDAEGNLITTATYNHVKDSVLVQPNDIIVYMLRVYNEGDMNGRAAEIKDHLPSYLEFVEGEFNNQYGWTASEDGRTVTTRYLENSVIEKAKKDENGEIVLSYKEVPIMCKVKADAKTNENITNIADITEYQDENRQQVEDRDSQINNVKLPSDGNLPNYKEDETGSYIPGQQDDDDFEKVHIKIFDLALRKWVTQAIVIENGKETVSQTGHKPWDEPEAVVKVELNRKKLGQVTVKFRYSIRVYNQGELEGYAKEVTDYIPEGLKFVAQDNPDWKDEGNNVISTRKLENTLLRPGEYADVEVLLTWINNENNMGLKVNTAEISEDYNEYDVPDKDSEPDNKKSGEDDIDDAPVMLSITTGQIRIYFTLGFIVLITVAVGVVLIKKFVL